MAEQLPGSSFHVVFTLPHELNELVLSNPKECLGLLFQCASSTLLQFASDPKYLGAKPGIVMVLHTWGQQMTPHYHVHCIVSAGGLNDDSTRWIEASNPKYLFPYKALSKVFRGKYLTGLDRLWRQGLRQPPTVALASDADWITFKRRLAKKKSWNVFIEAPFESPENLVKYLALYTHRVAISNSRILYCNDGQVGFRYKDYRKKNKDGSYRCRVLTLDTQTFAHRFLLHVLPKGFMRIRYYGLLASRNKKNSLAACKRIMALRGLIPLTEVLHNENQENEGTVLEDLVEDRQCPYCQGPLKIRTSLTQAQKDTARSLIWDSS